MKVHLIVVRGKPEGMVIPLQGRIFRIGRGPDCHLRPNSEEISREHAEISITSDRVVIRDLRSRNGTHVNNRMLTGPRLLADRDLIQVGELIFAISIEAAQVKEGGDPKSGGDGADRVSHADIDSWLVADDMSPTPDRPSGIYGGETQSLETQGLSSDETDDAGTASEEPTDATNPFAAKTPPPPVKPACRDTSDAASDLLMKLMEQRRHSRHAAR